jgi:mono/diheme cytochrome c family protein
MRIEHWLASGTLLCVAGCGSGDIGNEPGTVGSLRAAVQISGERHDVTAMRIDIVGASDACDAPPLATETLALEAEAAPGSLVGSGQHAFADGLFVLAPGAYRACAAPLAGEGPSAECGPTEALAEVSADTTTEIVLYSQCAGAANGGLDTLVALNDQPQITDLSLSPSKFITVCESASVAVTATDPDGDELTYTWSIVSGPEGGSLRTAGADATFSGAAGDYALGLSVGDGHGGEAALSFPIHVSAATCEVPADVYAIFAAGCSPCHTTGTSGGLGLGSPTAAYANLVGVASSSAACSSRVRAIPGDSASSYVIAKLRGETGICGSPMPRNRPALPEEQIASIAAWIDGLPH